jgi:hypothetical protein
MLMMIHKFHRIALIRAAIRAEQPMVPNDEVAFSWSWVFQMRHIYQVVSLLYIPYKCEY